MCAASKWHVASPVDTSLSVSVTMPPSPATPMQQLVSSLKMSKFEKPSNHPQDSWRHATKSSRTARATRLQPQPSGAEIVSAPHRGPCRPQYHVPGSAPPGLSSCRRPLAVRTHGCRYQSAILTVYSSCILGFCTVLNYISVYQTPAQS